MNSARGTAAVAVVLATAGTLLGSTAVTASAATTCASPVYKRELFANTTFKGTPKKTACDTVIDESWSGAPASGLPKDGFGVRWTVTRDFGSGGPFALGAVGTDGIRVYLDGSRKVNLWSDTTGSRSKTVNVTVPQGKHTLRVEYVNWTGSARVQVTYAPRTDATADKAGPLSPTGSSVSYDATSGRAKLTWSKNKEMDLAGYRVYRRLKGQSFGAAPLATTSGTAYTDSALPLTGDTYYYEVRALDRAGNESAGTADQAVTTVDRVAPGVPVVTKATGEIRATSSTGGLEVGWDRVPGAVTYRVFRAASENGTYTALGSTDGLTYLDTSADVSVVYYYRVSAVDAAGNESARSAPRYGKIWDNDPPALVTGLTVTPTGYGFRLDWDKSPATDLRYYTVYWGEVWTDDDGERICHGSLVDYVAADRTSYAYTTRPDGDEVCFFVDAVDREFNSAIEWNGPVEAVPATELDTTPSVATPEGSPLRLTASEATDGEGHRIGNRLEWSGLGAGGEESGDPAQAFRVYRWNPATAAYEQIAELPAGSDEYVDTGAGQGTVSYYWVTGVGADGTETAPAADWTVSAPAE